MVSNPKCLILRNFPSFGTILPTPFVVAFQPGSPPTNNHLRPWQPWQWFVVATMVWRWECPGVYQDGMMDGTFLNANSHSLIRKAGSHCGLLQRVATSALIKGACFFQKKKGKTFFRDIRDKKWGGFVFSFFICTIFVIYGLSWSVITFSEQQMHPKSIADIPNFQAQSANLSLNAGRVF